MAKRKNQSASKGEAIVKVFRNRNKVFHNRKGEDITSNLFERNVNWATAEETEKLKPANQQDYYNAIHGRRTKPVADYVIVIEIGQNALNIIFRNSLNIRDMGNPMFGEEDKTNRKNLNNNIDMADPEHNKVIVVYGGDLLGNEWELKNLNNAKIIESNINTASYQELKSVADEVLTEGEKPEKNELENVRKALYYGLTERVKVIVRDILATLKKPGVEVYLFNGAQEQKINKYFKTDILAKVVEIIDDPRVHYVRGVNTIINVEKKVSEKKSYFASIGMLTNNSLSKARKGQAAMNAVRLNSGENLANVVFVTNTNIVGKKSANEYYVSGESTFMETVAKKNPAERPRDYNTFSLRIPASGEITVIEGVNMPQANPLEMYVYTEYIKNKIYRDTLKRRVTESIDEMALPEGKDPVRSIQQALAKKSTATKVATPEDDDDMLAS